MWYVLHIFDSNALFILVEELSSQDSSDPSTETARGPSTDSTSTSDEDSPAATRSSGATGNGNKR